MAAMDKSGSQYEEYVPETSSSKLKSFGKGKLAKARAKAEALKAQAMEAAAHAQVPSTGYHRACITM